MKRWLIWTALVGLIGAFSPGCDSSTDTEEESSAEQEEHPHYYSPYYLQGEGDLEFETITFTDVGMQQPEAGPVDAFLLETIAESLAYKIIANEDLNFTPEVQHDQTLLDPMNHLHCDDDHLYIALWRGYEPERWGYSLWSGCEESQEFAWEEILDPYGENENEIDLVTHVEPLTESIVKSIKEAHDSDCFTLTC